MKNAIEWILKSGIFFAKKSGSERLDSKVEIEGAAQAAPDSQDGETVRDFTPRTAFGNLMLLNRSTGILLWSNSTTAHAGLSHMAFKCFFLLRKVLRKRFYFFGGEFVSSDCRVECH